jgi:hypothetical protein
LVTYKPRLWPQCNDIESGSWIEHMNGSLL